VADSFGLLPLTRRQTGGRAVGNSLNVADPCDSCYADSSGVLAVSAGRGVVPYLLGRQEVRGSNSPSAPLDVPVSAMRPGDRRGNRLLQFVNGKVLGVAEYCCLIGSVRGSNLSEGRGAWG
jgi:hypothetical protein